MTGQLQAVMKSTEAKEAGLTAHWLAVRLFSFCRRASDRSRICCDEESSTVEKTQGVNAQFERVI